MAGPVTRYVRERITRLLREHGVVVWYDTERAFGGVYESLEVPAGSKLALEGGYFRLRESAEEHTAAFRYGGSADTSLLVYVPAPPLPDKQNLLYPLECLGERFERTLRQEASTALRDQVPSARIQEWFEVEGLTLEKLDELVSAGTEIGSLAVVFGDATASQVAWRFLENRDNRTLAEIEAAGQFVPLRDLLTTEFGVRLPEKIEESGALRDAFAERVLLYEFLDDLDEIPAELESIAPPRKRTQIAACRELARRLRDSQALADSYERWALSSEKQFGLAEIEYDPARLGQHDTFPFEERLALGHAYTLAASERWDDARRWIEQRQRGFWVRHDEGRGGEWRVAELSVELWLAAEEKSRTFPASDDPRRWLSWYTAGSDEAGWQPDQLARKLAALRTSWLDRPNLGEMATQALERASELEHQAAERFVDAVAAQPEELSSAPSQLDIFRRQVVPSLDAGRKTALVLADALRFEMGHELFEMLGDGGELTLQFAFATLPTLTKVGMAALVPGAEDGLELAEDGKKVVPARNGHRLRKLADRRERYRAAYGDRVGDITLDDCLGVNTNRLRELVEEADLLLLLSQDLDEIGETDKAYRAANLMGQILSNLHGAIRRLANAGVEEFIVTADHGYLLREDLTDADKLDVPSGEILETHRRCVLGRGLGAGEHHVVLRCADVGLGGSLELAFPRGVNVFRKGGGNLAYLHGGISLQECVVPVLRYVPEIATRTAGRPTLELAVVGERVTNRYFPVMLSYHAGDLFDQDEARRFRIEATVQGDVVGRPLGATVGYREAGNAVELRSGEETAITMGITEDLEGEGKLEIRVFDTELGETVKKVKVPYEFAF